MQAGTGTFRLIALVASVGVTLSCRDTLLRVPEELPRAATVFACGPADGPAVQIFLSEKPISNGTPVAPYVSIYIDRSISELVPGTYPTSSSNPGVGIVRFASASSYEPAHSGFVRILSVAADRTVRGDIAATFADQGISGTFVAPWQERHILCG